MIPIKTWVVEDDGTYRRMLQRLLNREEDIDCERVFPSCPELFEALAAEPHPDLILMDLGLPVMGGVEGMRRLTELAPDLAVLVLTVFADKEKVLEALDAGAAGYLLKTAKPREIVRGVQAVFTGGAPLSPAVAKLVLAEIRKPTPTEGYNLSAREIEVMELLADGLLVKEIANKLSISRRTGAFHLNNIYKKLQVQSQAGAVAKAFRSGIL